MKPRPIQQNPVAEIVELLSLPASRKAATKLVKLTKRLTPEQEVELKINLTNMDLKLS